MPYFVEYQSVFVKKINMQLENIKYNCLLCMKGYITLTRVEVLTSKQSMVILILTCMEVYTAKQ